MSTGDFEAEGEKQAEAEDSKASAQIEEVEMDVEEVQEVSSSPATTPGATTEAEETQDELHRLLGPTTFGAFPLEPSRLSPQHRKYNAPCVALNCLAWLARPTPPENRRKGMTCL